MFENLVYTQTLEGTLYIYNANTEKFVFLVDNGFGDVAKILDNDEDIRIEIEQCGLDTNEFFIECEIVYERFGYQFYFMEA